ncbi:MAG TPA: hypothetical protein VN616_08530, partial [Puia sp.]|nr:hypothetical protein [Puia sp.]
ALLLLAICIYPGQGLLAHLLPGVAGRLTVDPRLTIAGASLHPPIPIDLILVPALFLILFATVIFIHARRSDLPAGACLLQRFSAILTGLVAIVFLVAVGALLSWMLRDSLPARGREALDALTVNATFRFSYTGYSFLVLNGDAPPSLGLLAGIVTGIVKLSRRPRLRRRFALTREQRMTPYQRMLRERLTVRSHRYEPAHGLCRTGPIRALLPEADSEFKKGSLRNGGFLNRDLIGVGISDCNIAGLTINGFSVAELLMRKWSWAGPPRGGRPCIANARHLYRNRTSPPRGQPNSLTLNRILTRHRICRAQSRPKRG